MEIKFQSFKIICFSMEFCKVIKKTRRKSHVTRLSPIEISCDANKGNVQHSKCHLWIYFPIKTLGKIYLFEVSSKSTGKRCEICSKLKINTTEQRRGSSGVFIVNFELYFTSFLTVSIADFEQVSVSWDVDEILLIAKSLVIANISSISSFYFSHDDRLSLSVGFLG